MVYMYAHNFNVVHYYTVAIFTDMQNVYQMDNRALYAFRYKDVQKIEAS